MSDDPAVSPSGIADTAQAAPRPEAQAPLAPGALIGRYQITEQLGQGGMGVVYRVWDGALKRMVALKLIRTRADDVEVQGRFEREAQAMAQLSHRNVVGVHDFGRHDGHPFLVMELVDGTSLRGWLGQRVLTWRRKVEVLISAARGLAAAHAAGLVHRDFKPENVLVGADGRIAVTDFGLARSYGERPEGAPGAPPAALSLDVTAANTVIGTPQYMAPEQYAAAKTDARTDVFAFGVVLYEVLFGERPFVAADFASMRAAVLAGQVKKPRAMRGVPAELLALAERCVKPDPAQRPQTLTAVIVELERALRPARWPRVALLIAGLAAGAGGLWWNARPGPGRSPIAAAQRAFDEGQAQMRGGSTHRAFASFQRALEADPDFAPAAVWLSYTSEDDEQQRGFIAAARDHRDRLDPRSAAFLDGIAFGSVPMPDSKAWLAHVEALIAAHPDFIELRLLRAQLLTRVGDYPRALETLDAAAPLDPAFAATFRAMRAFIETLRNHPAEARTQFDACLAANPDATDCLSGRAYARSMVGDCVGTEADARRWAALDPRQPRAFEQLANALYANGAPWPSIAEAMKARHERLDPATRARDDWYYRFQVEAVQGHLGAARDIARTAAADPALGQRLAAHLEPSLQLFRVLEELGDHDGMAALATDFLARAPAWTAETARETALIQTFVHADYLAGKETRAAYEARRARAVAAVQAAVDAEGRSQDSFSRNLVWLYGYAGAVKTREDATEALDALSSYVPLQPPGGRRYDTNLTIGIVYALAGRAAEADPYLALAANSCRALDHPLSSQRARLWMAKNRLALGDVAGARKALERVLAAWPNPTPRSVVVEEAKALLAALPQP